MRLVAEQLPQPNEEYFPTVFKVIISLAETGIHHSQLYQTSSFFGQATLPNLEIHVMLEVLSGHGGKTPFFMNKNT